MKTCIICGCPTSKSMAKYCVPCGSELDRRTKHSKEGCRKEMAELMEKESPQYWKEDV